jgi:hypothetical protein
MDLPVGLPTHPYYMTALAGDPSYNVPEPSNPSRTGWWQDGSDDPDGMTFADFLDIINPLQHLPIISTIYRAISGDKIGLAAKLVGGTLFGGPAGFLAQGVISAFESGAGKTTGEMLAELFHDVFGPDDAPDAAVALAANPSQSGAPETVTPAAPTKGDTRNATIAWQANAPPAPLLPMPVERGALSTAHAPKTGTASPSGNDAASRRIAATVAAAQRAQMGLLLANLQAETQAPASSLSENQPEAAAISEAGTAPKNPYLPRDAETGGWTSESMDQAIARYERVLRDRKSVATPLRGE